MGKSSSQKKRENGVYYTPTVLAEYLVAPFITSDVGGILDPSYGEGSLLLAAERVYNRLETRVSINLHGCDIKPVNGLLRHLPEANLKKVDFFDFIDNGKFELLLMNPPYVRHHYLDGKKLEKSREKWPVLNVLSNSADLWAYFMVKAGEHLKIGGNIAAILPWSFLQADYAQEVRVHLAKHFEEIKVLCLSEKYFHEADERVILLWLKNYGRENRKISIASSNSITDSVEYKDMPKEFWTLKKVPYTGNYSALTLMEIFRDSYGFSKLGDHADVKIGIVTAGNKYFIRKREALKGYGLRANRLKPILLNSKELQDYLQNGKKNLKCLVHLVKGDHEEYRKFIDEGVRKKMNKTAHAVKRDPWYRVKVGEIPDAFFPYRMSKIPFLILNKDHVLCTNSIHGVYFKKLTQRQAKWLQVSILSDISQLSMEINAKTYGRGVLKMEPTALKNSLVYISKDKTIDLVFTEVNKYLKSNQKEEARKVATEFIVKHLKIPISVLCGVPESIKTFENLRLKKS